MDHVLALQDRVHHAVVVDEMPQRLDHLRLAQCFVLLVGAEIVDAAALLLEQLQLRIGGDRLGVVGRHPACDIDVALLQQEPARGKLRHMPYEDALQRDVAAPIALDLLEHDGIIRLPGAQHVGAGARGVGLQPFIAEIAICFVLHRDLLVDDRGDDGGEDVVEERLRVGLVGGDGELVRAGRLDQLIDVFRGEAELGQDEGRRLVELDDALQRPGGVFRGDRVAAVELQPLLHLEGIGPAVVADAPALRQAGLQREIGRRPDLDQPVVDVLQRILAGKLEAFRRVERDDVVDRVGDDERVGRRFRARRNGKRECRERDERQCADWFHFPVHPCFGRLGLLSEFDRLRLLLSSFGSSECHRKRPGVDSGDGGV